MKWLFENIGARFRFALRNPGYAAASLLRELNLR